MTSNGFSLKDEWYTPPAIVEAARVAMGGIDLDPASCEEANKVVRAAAYWTAADGPLERDWTGRVWLNPPYGQRMIRQFYWAAIRSQVVFCVLCPQSPSVHAWHILSNADAVCWVDTRSVRGWWGPAAAGKDPRGPYRMQPLIVGVFGVDPHRAAVSFAKIGPVMQRISME